MNDTQGPPSGQGIRPRSRFLRLLKPSEPPKPKGRRPRRPVFTASQEAWIRTALRNARASFGTWACLADAMGLGKTLVIATAHGHRRVTGNLVIRFAVATGTSVDALLHPSIQAAGRCPGCGRTREGLQ